MPGALVLRSGLEISVDAAGVCRHGLLVVQARTVEALRYCLLYSRHRRSTGELPAGGQPRKGLEGRGRLLSEAKTGTNSVGLANRSASSSPSGCLNSLWQMWRRKSSKGVDLACSQGITRLVSLEARVRHA